MLSLVCLALTSGAEATDSLARIVSAARADAAQWRADAGLVQVEFMAFGFATGPSGFPDVTRTGPPRAAIFHFLSPSAHQALQVIADLNQGSVRPEPLRAPYSPFTAPIPRDLRIDLDHALAQATKAIGRECTGGDPLTSKSCPLVSGAELHMDGASVAGAGRPVWTVHFGQNPRTLAPVSRAIDARTGAVIASNTDQSPADEPTGVIPAIRAMVVGLRFFESPAQPTRRNYDDLFFYNAARYIYWELNLVHPAPGQRTSFTLEDIWHAPGGDVVHRATQIFTVEGSWTSSYFFSSARLVGTKTVDIHSPLYYDCLQRQRENRERGRPEISCSPTMGVDIEQWPRRTYQVDVLLDKQRIATGWFAMRTKEEIYGEVRAKTRDRSAPAGVIAPLGAKVTSLRFFKAGATAPPRGQRSYAIQFSQATTRYVVWELNLSHPAPHRWLSLPVEALLYFRDAQGERIVQRKVFQTAVPADWSDTYHMDSFGWENDYYYDRAGSTTPSPRRWLPGTYRVDLYVVDRKVASGSFEVR